MDNVPMYLISDILPRLILETVILFERSSLLQNPLIGKVRFSR